MLIEKYVGRIVEVIYEDRYGKLSKRRLRVREVTAHHVKAFCLDTQGSRLFIRKNILALEPAGVKETAVRVKETRHKFII